MNVTDGGNFLYIDDISVGDQDLSVSQQEKVSFEVYPNPNDGKFTIAIKKKYQGILNLYSIEGQLLQMFHIEDGCASISVVNLSKGVYFLGNNESDFRWKKIIVQ